MDALARRAPVALLLCCIAAVAVVVERRIEAPAAAPTVTHQLRSAGLRFAPNVPAADRAWVLAAVASARPEAQRLIDEIDGLVEVQTHVGGGPAIGWARMDASGAIVSVDTAALNGDRALDRNVVVLHELGHVIDHVLVPDELVRELDRGIPRSGTCAPGSEPTGPCTAVAERFADTYAKWALRGRVSLAGSGYAVPTPPSLEDWGAPLARLAAQLGS
jgi:hypothetical protein